MRTNCLRVIGATALAVIGQGAIDAALGITAVPAGPFIVPGFNWTGFYVGAHGGYASESIGQFKPKVGFGGAQIGYNYQIDNFVLGLEFDLASAGATQTINSTVLGFVP